MADNQESQSNQNNPQNTAPASPEESTGQKTLSLTKVEPPKKQTDAEEKFTPSLSLANLLFVIRTKWAFWRQRRNRAEKARFTDKVIMVATVVIAIAAYFQWREMHAGGEQTDKIICEDQRIANAMEGAVGQATKSLNATVEQFHLEQRAWLGVGDETYNITETENVESTVRVTNTGKSPAIDIVCHMTGTTKLKDSALVQADIVYPPELPEIKQGTIFPNQQFPLKTYQPVKLPPDKQSAWFKNIQGGEWIQYFWGEIHYRDAFGVHHWTHFCARYLPSTKSGTPCSIYNDTDSNK